MQARPCRPALLLLIIGLLVPSLPGIGFAQTRPLKILLTNDDGFDSAGLTVMRAALVAAGHQVTVVAPATNMSSSSLSMTSGVITIENKGDAVWAVYGTPADAAVIGLTHIMRDTPQDLVISGTNAGQNLGTSTNGSGTVSAAIAASRYGVPAIATSAALVNQMIPALDATRPAGGKLLPDRFVININVPASALTGLKWAPLSSRSSYARVYSNTANPGECSRDWQPLPPSIPKRTPT